MRSVTSRTAIKALAALMCAVAVTVTLPGVAHEHEQWVLSVILRGS
jgi:hypothetical protein